jgi:hypothetical protein
MVELKVMMRRFVHVAIQTSLDVTAAQSGEELILVRDLNVSEYPGLFP